MKKPLTATDIEQIILMAWGDTIPFEVIEREYGLGEEGVKKLMRAHQSARTYARWRKRVRGRIAKHEGKGTVTSMRQKF